MVRYSATLDNPRNNGFVSAFKAIRDGGEPDQYAQAGYDSLYLLAKAIKRANSTNPAEVREALAKSKYVSVTGSPIRFDERNQVTPKLYVAVIKDGRRVIVEDVDNTCHVPKSTVGRAFRSVPAENLRASARTAGALRLLTASADGGERSRPHPTRGNPASDRIGTARSGA